VCGLVFTNQGFFVRDHRGCSLHLNNDTNTTFHSVHSQNSLIRYPSDPCRQPKFVPSSVASSGRAHPACTHLVQQSPTRALLRPTRMCRGLRFSPLRTFHLQHRQAINSGPSKHQDIKNRLPSTSIKTPNNLDKHTYTA
jgi:hypothetical protein